MTLLEQARVFADCAGRYTGMTEHQWMFDGPASEDSAGRLASGYLAACDRLIAGP